MTATIRLTPPRDLGPGLRVVIDCRHGTTTIDQLIQPGRSLLVPERVMVAMAVERHEAEEGCGCVVFDQRPFLSVVR